MPVTYMRLRQPMSHIERLDTLYERMKRDPKFKALSFDNPFVEGEGNDTNPVAFIVGKAPGAQEAEKRRPFVGRAGMVMRSLMRTAGLFSTWHGKMTGGPVPPFCAEGLPPNVWLTNTIKWRPVGNRTPTNSEIEAAAWYIRREWEEVGRPKLIIAVGRTAFQCITGETDFHLLKIAGEIRTNERGITIVPMIHPAAALRQESLQAVAEMHWLMLGDWLDRNAADK